MAGRREKRRVRVRGSTWLVPGVKSIEFEAVDGAPVGHVAGQWVNLFIPTTMVEEGEVRRSYSIASAPNPDHPSRFEVAVTLVENGPGSTALHALEPGQEIDMEGPWGVFTLQRSDPAAPILFVGTGTGVTPFRAMLADLHRTPAEGPRLVLLFGCRTEADVLYRAEFERLAMQWPRFRFDFTLSRPDASWSGRRGYVQAHIPEWVAALGAPHVFVCGLSKMVQDVRRLLKDELGFERQRVHTERYD